MKPDLTGCSTSVILTVRIFADEEDEGAEIFQFVALDGANDARADVAPAIVTIYD